MTLRLTLFAVLGCILTLIGVDGLGRWESLSLEPLQLPDLCHPDTKVNELGACGRLEFATVSLRGKGAQAPKSEVIYSNLHSSLLPESQFNETLWKNSSLVSSQLPHSSWEGCRWEGVEVILSKLPQSRFTNCHWRGVVLRDCDLRGSDFQGVKIEASRFLHCDLRAVDFRGADLSGAEFYLCDLRGARFDPLTQLPFPQTIAIQRGMVHASPL